MTRTAWQDWTSERGLRTDVAVPTRGLTLALFDVYRRRLVPHALRAIALASWAERFEELPPLADHDLAVAIAEVRELAPVMHDVIAARRQHLFFSSYLRALEDLARVGDHVVYADAGPWSTACRRLLTFLDPPDVMRAAFQAVIDGPRDAPR
ncbi:unnamed protein product [marine sediment metagenome]|uniref:Uncharacterized protein n=1 Tax=marine sediment metagenome TaxID=412755 RepID=X1FV82_9ZZZZ